MQVRECADLSIKPPIKKGPQEGRYQPEPHAKAKKRYLLDKKVQTGPDGGKFQSYRSHGRAEKRYLLHKK